MTDNQGLKVRLGSRLCISLKFKKGTIENSAVKILRGDELPPVLAESFSDGKPDDVYVVRVRRLSAHDAAKLAALRADVQVGLDAIAAGRVEIFDVEALIGELREGRTEVEDARPVLPEASSTSLEQTGHDEWIANKVTETMRRVDNGEMSLLDHEDAMKEPRAQIDSRITENPRYTK